MYALFVVAMLSFSVSRGLGRYLSAIVGVSMIVLLVLSIAFLFIDRRLALRGLLVCLLGLIIGVLFPEL